GLNGGVQWGVVVEAVGVAIALLGDRGIDEVRGGAGNQHDHAHHEDPHQQLHLYGGILHREQNKGDQRDSCYAIGFKAIGAGTHRVARVVASAVGDYARVAGIVFLDLEDNFHQIGADVGKLGEDAARNTHRCAAVRLAHR